MSAPWHCRFHLWHTWGRWVPCRFFDTDFGSWDGQQKKCLDCGKQRNRS